MANGFSCREQIRQNTEREALHVAEVLQMALHPEQPRVRVRRPLREIRPAYPIVLMMMLVAFVLSLIQLLR